MQFLIDTSPAIDEAIPTPDEIAEFWSKPNWVSEARLSREQTQNSPWVIFRTDAIQYNAMGYKRISNYISQSALQLFSNLPNAGEYAERCRKN